MERALTLGVDPGQLTAPRGGAVVGGIGFSVFCAVQIYRAETGSAWAIVVAGAVFASLALLIAVLLRIGTRRSGVSARHRLGGIRATTRTELAGDDWLWRIGAVQVGALLPLPMLLSTGLVADRAWRGHGWPLWAAMTAVTAGFCGVLLTLLGARWWYGAWLARRMVRYGRLIAVQLVVAGGLAAGTLALTAHGDAPRWEWVALAAAHLAWAVLGASVALVLVWRIQLKRHQAPLSG